VSGGADSSALLVLAVAAGCEVTAVHVDHGTRTTGAIEAAEVERLAHRYGASFESRRVAVASGPNFEARARTARLGALGPGALLGHTADDQAENVMLALLRGSGLDGLAAMDPATHPMLDVRRHECEALCSELGINVFRDPSNDDLRFRRNAVRQRLLPLMNEVAQRDVVPLLSRTAQLVSEEAFELDARAAVIDPTSCHELMAAPKSLARRALRRWLSDPYPPDRAGLDRAWQVVTGQVIGCELPGGVAVRRTAMTLRQIPQKENPGQ
jgi:tRNA(Ile)-lysidine synthase